MSHALFLDRDRYMRFETHITIRFPRLNRTDHSTVNIPSNAWERAWRYCLYRRPPHPRHRLLFSLYWQNRCLLPIPQLLEVALVRRNGAPALTGHYLAENLPRLGMPSHMEHFLSASYQLFPLSGHAEVEPSYVVGVTTSPLCKHHLTHTRAQHIFLCPPRHIMPQASSRLNPTAQIPMSILDLHTGLGVRFSN